MKKGFTLIELLAVIVILAIVAVIAIPQIIKIINYAKVEAFNRQIEFIVDAAKKYAVKYPDKIEDEKITLNQLIEAKLIKGDMKDLDNRDMKQYYIVDLTSKKPQVYSNYHGETIIIKNSVESSIKKIKIYGKSQQLETTQGKNLFDAYKWAQSMVSYLNNSNQCSIVTHDGRKALKIVGLAYNYTFGAYGNYKLNIPGTSIMQMITYTTSPKYGNAVLQLNANNVGYLTSATSWERRISGGITNLTSITFLNFPEYTTYIDLDSMQIESGATATTVEAFIPSRPTPLYPSSLNNVNNFKFTITNNSSEKKEVTFPNITLNSLDNLKDYIEIDNVKKTAKLVQNIGTITLTGNELVSLQSINSHNVANFYINVNHSINSKALSSHFKQQTSLIDDTTNHGFLLENGTTIYMRMKVNDLPEFTVTAFKTWLTNQYNAGTPVSFIYQLPNEIIMDLNYETYKDFKIYNGNTNISKTGLSSEIEVEAYVNNN